MHWPSGWQPLDDAAARGFVAELEREVARGHALYGVPLRAVARLDGSDDVLFAVEDGSGRFAEVHLTWCSGRDRPPWPMATLFDGWEAWSAAAEAE